MVKYLVRVGFVLSLALSITMLVVHPIAEVTKPKPQKWTVLDSKSYAYDKLGAWKDKQMSCLEKLWGKESAWNPKAHNKIKVMGKNAGGIPQLLGLDPSTPPTKQIDRGLSYIYYRYGTPCRAWEHFLKKGWH